MEGELIPLGIPRTVRATRHDLKSIVAGPQIRVKRHTPVLVVPKPVAVMPFEPVLEGHAFRRSQTVGRVVNLEYPPLPWGQMQFLLSAFCFLLCSRPSIPKHHLPIRLHLLDHDWRRQFRALHFLWVDDHHTLHSREPDSTLNILATGRLVVPAIAFAVEHSIRLPVRDAQTGTTAC